MVATGYTLTPEHTHDQDEVTGLSAALDGKADDGHTHSYAPADHLHVALVLAPKPGTTWYLTDDPFNAALLATLATGDRFTYPLGHAQERETYEWNGSSWTGPVETLEPVPAVADMVVVAPSHTHALPAAGNITPATNMTNGTTGQPIAQEIVPGWIALSGRIQATAAGSANQQIGSLPAGHWPAAEERPTVRFIGTGASTGSVTISTGGVMTYNSALPISGEVPLSGILFRKA